MRAIVIHAPKDLRVDELASTEPSATEVRVRTGAGGICGSDLHYYHNGGFGTVRIKEPMTLGHEIAGVIDRVGSSVSHLVAGMRVAVNPSRPCNTCRYCMQGMRNQCLDMIFLGSAMRFPHVQGGFKEFICVDAVQAIPIADNISMGEAAMAEPLAVCLHAARQAGALQGKRVLVTGCGPIGVLAFLVAKNGGAAEIVVTDVMKQPLELAAQLGAARVFDVANEPEALEPYRVGKGYFDVLFEASGNQAALRSAFDVLKPGGIIVQLGLGNEMTLPVNTIVAKELKLCGTFRFDTEFELAIEMMARGLIDVKPLISKTLSFEHAAEAFELASDRTRAMKVQLAF